MDYFLKSQRLGFRCWQDEDLPLAMKLWGDSEVSALLGGPFTPEQVRERLQQEVDRLCAPLAHYESVKRFALIPSDFTFENGELTYTMKLKRLVIERKYAAQIDGIYAEAEAEPRPPASH